MKVKNKLKRVCWKVIGDLSQAFKIARGAINHVLIKMSFDKAETIKRSENFIHLLKEEIAEYKEHIEGYKELVNKLKTTNAELEKQYYEALAKIAKENGEDFVLENNNKNIALESKPKQFKKSNPTNN